MVKPLTPPKAVEDPPLVAALRCLLEKRSEEAINYLLEYDKPTQELLLCLLPAVARLSAGNLESADPHELAHLIDQLDSALTALRPQSPLNIEHLCFCRGIDGYGLFECLPENHPFRPGELVEVYAEVRNFTRRRQGRYHEIHLGGMLEIRDPLARFKPRKVMPLRTTTDRSQSPRHDLYQSYRFWVPEDLPPGHYTLELQVTDVASTPPRSARRSLHLWVTTRPRTGP